MTPRTASITAQDVQALKHESNQVAHVLFLIYERIERTMVETDQHALDDLFACIPYHSTPTPAVADLVRCKLREDGFTVQPCQARSLLGRWRISWKIQPPMKRGPR